jgi:hypothetical protein
MIRSSLVLTRTNKSYGSTQKHSSASPSFGLNRRATWAMTPSLINPHCLSRSYAKEKQQIKPPEKKDAKEKAREKQKEEERRHLEKYLAHVEKEEEKRQAIGN